MGQDSDPPLIDARRLSKRFGAVWALREGNLRLVPGEVHAIVGDNGAGKSTMIKIIAGVFAPDSGELKIEGKGVALKSPRDAEAHGVATVHQTLALVDHLDITANLFLGNELRYPPPLSWFGVLRRSRMRGIAREELRRLNIGVRSVDELVAGLSGGQRQSIAVARALARGGRIVIMDEPTAALGVRESAQVHDIIFACREHGLGVILISHNMQEVFKLADRISVFRLGETIACVEKAATSPNDLVGMITGAKEATAPKAVAAGEEDD